MILQYAQPSIWSTIRDISATAAIVVGGIGAYLALSRQLKLSSVTEVFKQELEGRGKLQRELQSQISFVSTAFNRWPPFVTPLEMKGFIRKAQSLEKLSSQARSEVANVCLLLRLTMQRVDRYYTSQNTARPTTEIAWFYESILHTISILNVKIRTFPSVLALMRFTKNVRFYDKNLVKYGRDNKSRVLRFADYGISLDPLRSEIISFFETAQRSGDAIIQKSATRVLSTIVPVSRCLFAKGLYLPTYLDSTITGLGTETEKFILCGYKLMTIFTDNGRQVVDGFYVPIDDRLRLNARTARLISTEKDLYLKVEVRLEPIDVSLMESSIVKLQFGRAEVEKRFSQLRRKIVSTFKTEKRRSAQPGV